MTSIYLHDNTKPLKLEVAVSDLQDVARGGGRWYNDLSELGQMCILAGGDGEDRVADVSIALLFGQAKKIEVAVGKMI